MVRRFTTESGKAVLLGENAGENEKLCKDARQNDEWFHLDAGASPHAILQCGGKLERGDIHDCAQLVKHFSKQRKSPRAFVQHIACKFVSKNGCYDDKGKVTLKKKASRVAVVPDENTLTRLVGAAASPSSRK